MSFTIRPVREERTLSSRIRHYTVIGAGIVESLVHLYRRMKDRQEKEERRERVLKRAVAILLSGLLILLVVIGALKMLIHLKAISMDSMVSAVSADLPKDEDGFTNVLLVGVGDSDHSGIDLTDTIMVVSLDPEKSKSAVLLSLPRDLYFLATEKMGAGRLNSLYRDYKGYLMATGKNKGKASHEALRQLSIEIGTLTGLPIHGAIKLNFSGFEQAIAALGGIDVIVPEDIVDPEYPGPDYTYEIFTILKGPQHLDGPTALKYARTRHTTSDFSRSGRQQQIIAAAADKARKLGMLGSAGKATRLMTIVANNMETTLSTRQLLGLVQIGKKIDQHKIVNMQLTDENGLYEGVVRPGGFLYAPPREQFDGASVLLPVSIPEMPVTWKQIQTLGKLLFGHREAFVQTASIVILNAGAKAESARRLGNELIRYGFTVIKTRNFAKGPNPSSGQSSIAMNPALLTDSKDALLVDRSRRARSLQLLLGKVLSIPNMTVPDASAFQPEQPEIVIVLGKDFHYTPLQDLIR